MYLEKRPTIFTKNGQIQEVFYTWKAAELKAAGWVILGEDETSAADVEDTPDNQDQEQDSHDVDEQEDESELSPDLSGMTKAELVAYADSAGIRIDPHAVKAKIISMIEDSEGEIERG